MRQFDRYVGQHTEDEMEEEIMKPQEWVKTATVTKIRDHTHVAKGEFKTVEIAERVLRDGLLMYYMQISPSHMSREGFISIQTCFSCYRLEDYPTNKCTDNRIMCYLCTMYNRRSQMGGMPK